MSIIKKLLGSGNYITVNKIVIKKLGLLEAVLLGNFIDKYNYFEERNMLTEQGEFFNIVENIKKDTGITEHQQRQTIQTLIDYNLLSVNKKGLPAKNYYKLHFDKIENLFNDSTSELKSEALDKSNFSINKNTKYNNTKKELSKDNKEDKSSFDFNSNFSPIKDEIIKYFDLYKKLHPMANKDKYYTIKKINKINRLCKFILNGFPKNKFNIIREFIKEKNIPYNPDIGFNGDINKFKELLNNAFLSLDVKYEPSNKPNITSDFSEFLINEYTEFSYFFEYGFNPPKLIQEKVKEVINPKSKNKYPLYVRDYAKLIGIDETDELISFVNRLVKLNEQIRNKKINGYTRDQLTPTSEQDTSHLYTIYNDYIGDVYGFLNQFEEWLREKTDYEGFKWNEKFFDSYMKEFNKWFYNRYDGTSFFISNETMQDKLDEYLERKK